MDDITEKMLAISTIDDPVSTRQLFLDMEANLPLPVSFTEHGLKGLKAQGGDISEYQDDAYLIDSLLYSGDMGGILCKVATKKGKNLTVISITHLKVDPEHPLADRIKQYQKKRTLALAIANSGTKRSAAKPKRNKRGFGV